MVEQGEAAIEERSGTVRSVEKAMAILYAFSHDEPELGVMELSRRLSLHKSTISRLLMTLEQGGLVERNLDTGCYRLGVELIALAGHVVQHADLRGIARPRLEALAEECRETANLVILHQGEAMNIEQFVPADRQIKDVGWVGRRTPLHATSTGKVLLAYLPDGERERVIEQLELTRFTEHTIVERERLRRELGQVRHRGYALGMEELEIGLNSVAAPVRDHAGMVCAAVSISGPAYRLTRELIPDLTSHVLEAAAHISRSLGWTEN